MSFLSHHPIFKIQCYNCRQKVKKKKIPLIMDSKCFLGFLPSRETDNSENPESIRSTRKVKLRERFGGWNWWWSCYDCFFASGHHRLQEGGDRGEWIWSSSSTSLLGAISLTILMWRMEMSLTRSLSEWLT